MSFEPVRLIHPNGVDTYTARSAVDLNDRLTEGYRKVRVPVHYPRPTPRPVIAPKVSSDTAE